MTESTPRIPARDDELAERVVPFKRTFQADAAAIKRDLAQWLDAHPSNGTATPIALLETAIDLTLAQRTTAASHLPAAAADVSDMVQAVLRRAVQKRRATLQMSISARPRPAADQADDEECANRLSDTLKLLDMLAARVPDHLVSREELASVSEILAILLGWFAGGIDQPPRAGKASQ